AKSRFFDFLGAFAALRETDRDHPMNRRQFLCRSAGLGLYPALSLAAAADGGGLLAPRPAHAPPRAKHLVFVFLTGGVSHIDTFDPKPKLLADHGKVVPSVDLRGAGNQPLLGSPFKFAPCGKSRLMVSEIFPRLGAVADELCVIRTLHTDIVEHF